MMRPHENVLDRLERLAADRPGDVAIVHAGAPALTFAALWERASRLGAAHPPARGGTGLDHRRGSGEVARLGHRRAWDVVGRHAFLPVAPATPDERLSAIVDAAGPAFALAAGPAAEVLRRRGVPMIGVAGTCDGQEPRPASLRVQTRADDLAYVIFTSGSTGRPKGVMVAHRGIVPMLDDQVVAFGLRPGCRALWLLSPAFDASLSDVGTALLAGATLCIEPDGPLGPAAGLLDVLRGRGITHVDLPPALLGVLDLAGLPDCVETIVIGGEPCPPEVVRRWAARVRLVNVYGPTEATVCTSLCVCDPVAWIEPLLGRPIAGACYHVLDESLRPVPPGTPGELCLTGPGLALGYLGEHALTARKFPVRNGQRLYRTGDRVVVRDDGEYVFLGRVDRQVKILGMLVEPEEVEARLREHPGVAHAAVVTRVLGRGRRQGLVAFVVPRDRAAAPTVADLRRHLAELALLDDPPPRRDARRPATARLGQARFRRPGRPATGTAPAGVDSPERRAAPPCFRGSGARSSGATR